MFLAFPRRSHILARKQQGAALIMAMVVVTVVVLLASTINTDFVVTYKRVENQLLGQQAYAYMRGAEGIARQVMQEDYLQSPDKDHASEGWLNNTVEFPTEQGLLTGTLCDLQARFNLNSLPSKKVKKSLDQQMFMRLLQALEIDDPIDQQMAEDIMYAVSDWIDSDSDVSSTGGAEDGYYSSMDIPMRPANQPMQSVSELRWVKGVTNEIYKALLPYVVTLPGNTPININTIELPVLRSVNEESSLQPLSESEASGILNDRDGDIDGGGVPLNGGFENMESFVTAHPATSLDTSRFSVNSEYFLLNTETYFMDRKFILSSVLHRNSSGEVKTIARGKSGFGQCVSNND